MTVMNVFRILGDLSHTVSKLILIWAIHVNRSAEGVSLITQVLYAIVFCSRYLDLFWANPFGDDHMYNTVLKIFYISSSLWIIFIMLKLFSRTRERERAWKFGAACLGGSLFLAPFAMLIFNPRIHWYFTQLLLLRQTTVPTVIDSMYLITLGSYRALYILNWIQRGMTEEGEPRPVPVIFGVIQTLFYLDFAWVYWTRQRVKLRNGAVVDTDDFSRGYLVTKILGRVRPSFDAERDGSDQDGWGQRGISVSADEEERGPKPPAKNSDGAPEETQGMLSAPDAFEDHDSDVDDALPAPLPRGSEA